ncbi:hypothetical protein ABW20_dc0101415 [Dactylellina cionopaga]|nr:hypothetical protein ABW20_dc0101415 [Dactylellina cionopaga]
MKFFEALGAAALVAPLAFAKPVPFENSDSIVARAADVCKDVQLIVSLLQFNRAAPFCSSFLGIKAATVPATKVSTLFTTTTVTQDVYATVTETAQTQVLSFTDVTTVATVPTTVTTQIVPSVTVIVVTSTPDPYVIYTTTYTTPAGVQARSAAVEERGVKIIIPPFDKKLQYYQTIVGGRTFGGLGNFPMPTGDQGLSLCCQKCYDTPGCALWK